MIGIICANGNVLPPMLVFPIVRYDAAGMMHGVSDGAKGLAYPKSWMTSQIFIHVLNHLKENVCCNVNKKFLIIMNNHESHFFIEAIDFSRENGILILAIPPHTSSKLQPLDYLDYLKSIFHNQ